MPDVNIETLTENVPDMVRSMSLETFGLIMILVTVVLSLTATILTIFELWMIARAVATLTVICLVVAFISLSVHLLFFRDDW